MSVILEVRSGDIYNPATLQKLDRITKFMIYTKGVVPYQVTSIADPKVRTAVARGFGTINLREIFFPGPPQTQEEAERVRFRVHADRGVRGVLVATDDTAAVVHAAFWEEALDSDYLHARMAELERSRGGRESPHLHHGASVAVHLDPAIHARDLRGLWVHSPVAGVLALRLLPDVDGDLAATLLGPALDRLGSRDGRRARLRARPAPARHSHVPHRARPEPLRPVDGPLPRRVLPARRPAPGDRRILLASVSASDRRDRDRWTHAPGDCGRADPTDPEDRGRRQLLGGLHSRQRGHPSSHPPVLPAPTRAAREARRRDRLRGRRAGRPATTMVVAACGAAAAAAVERGAPLGRCGACF